MLSWRPGLPGSELLNDCDSECHASDVIMISCARCGTAKIVLLQVACMVGFVHISAAGVAALRLGPSSSRADTAMELQGLADDSGSVGMMETPKAV
jgi:hypothetical protein